MMDNKKIIDIILIIITAILIIVNCILFIGSFNSKKETNKISNTTTEETISKKETKSEEELELEKLQKMTERDRMEYYFSKYISYIKNKEYTKSYDLLYPEFKQNYFKTQEEFKTYVEKLYPSSVGFSYDNIERQGDVYVLIITVIDTNKQKGQEKKQRIVVQEKGFNDFVLSFQVI